jgi:hypothetical protein
MKIGKIKTIFSTLNAMKGLIALMAKQALFNLDVKAATCSLHDSVQSIVRPRNFVLLIFVSIVIICFLISFCFLKKKKKKCVLL